LYPGNNYIVLDQLDTLAAGTYLLSLGANLPIKLIKN